MIYAIVAELQGVTVLTEALQRRCQHGSSENEDDDDDDEGDDDEWRSQKDTERFFSTGSHRTIGGDLVVSSNGAYGSSSRA
ncbi:unnamed protein product [Heligmosomoides polygyrus]|uniref:Secreted protein n=1 Tax=Heligmosomoides polygyrus TaxID=6339 RepID=A0A183GJI1_HELPZ|nr:unnamed protein product [Heligmosomoides polygyrus]